MALGERTEAVAAAREGIELACAGIGSWPTSHSL